VHTVKKALSADPADENLPEGHRFVKSGFKFTAHLEHLQTLLGNNANLYALLGRGDGAVNKLLIPLMDSEKVNR
jgi:hypothetical protein